MSEPQERKSDPADADFGRAAAEKAEQLDRASKQPGEVPEDPARQGAPRAGSKAEPDQPSSES